MAEHRRVEPHIALVGTGMAVDAEHIAAIEDEAERRARAWRDAPERGFGDVLQAAPARGHLEDETEPDPRRRPPVPTPDRAGLATDALKPNAAAAGGTAATASRAKANLPRVAPDPRQAMLERKLAAATPPKGAPAESRSAPAESSSPRTAAPSEAARTVARRGAGTGDRNAAAGRSSSGTSSAALDLPPPPNSTASSGIKQPAGSAAALPAAGGGGAGKNRAPAPVPLDDAKPEATPPTGKTGRPR